MRAVGAWSLPGPEVQSRRRTLSCPPPNSGANHKPQGRRPRVSTSSLLRKGRKRCPCMSSRSPTPRLCPCSQEQPNQGTRASHPGSTEFQPASVPGSAGIESWERGLPAGIEPRNAYGIMEMPWAARTYNLFTDSTTCSNLPEPARMACRYHLR
jgi:hypothetical protein